MHNLSNYVCKIEWPKYIHIFSIIKSLICIQECVNACILNCVWIFPVHLCNIHGDYETHIPLPLNPRTHSFAIFSLTFSSDNTEILGGYIFFICKFVCLTKKICGFIWNPYISVNFIWNLYILITEPMMGVCMCMTERVTVEHWR